MSKECMSKESVDEGYCSGILPRLGHGRSSTQLCHSLAIVDRFYRSLTLPYVLFLSASAAGINPDTLPHLFFVFAGPMLA